MRTSLFCLLIAGALGSTAQSLHLSERFLLPGDTLYGIAYFTNPDLVGYAYYISLFDQNRKSVQHHLNRVVSKNHDFSFAIPDSLPSGKYTVELLNYHNTLPSHVAWIYIGDQNELVTSPGKSDTELESPIDFKLNRQGDQESLNFSLPYPNVDQVSVSIADLEQHPVEVLPSCDLSFPHSISHRGLNTFLKGYSVSGMATDSIGNPLAETYVVMTVKKESRDTTVFHMLSTRSTAEGKFLFSNLDFEGDFVANLNAPAVSGEKLSILASNRSYLTGYDDCDSKASGQITEEALRLRQLNELVTQQYKPLQKTPIWNPQTQLLLQHVDQITDLDEYVSFSTVTQMIKEAVKFLYFKQGKLSVFSTELQSTHAGEPVLLLNGIPVDQEKILSLDVSTIRYVELAHQLRTLASYGSFAKGGVVSFITRDPVMIRSTSVELDGYLPAINAFQAQPSDDAPFFPSLFVWNSNLKPDSDNTYRVQFPKPVYDTRYLIEITVRTTTNQIYTFKEVINPIEQP